MRVKKKKQSLQSHILFKKVRPSQDNFLEGESERERESQQFDIHISHSSFVRPSIFPQPQQQQQHQKQQKQMDFPLHGCEHL